MAQAFRQAVAEMLFPAFQDGAVEREYRYFAFSGVAPALQLARLHFIGATMFSLVLLFDASGGIFSAQSSGTRTVVIVLYALFIVAATLSGAFILLRGTQVSPRRSAALSVLIFSAAGCLSPLVNLTRGVAHFQASLACVAGYGLLVPGVQLRYVVWGLLGQAAVRLVLTLFANLPEAPDGRLFLRSLGEEVLLISLGLALAKAAEDHSRNLFRRAKLFLSEEGVVERVRNDIHRLLLNTLPEPIVRVIASGQTEIAHR